ncbi:unnamed protein product [Rotaria sp. Silwood1]|nr:unnamed protein product [Rotaria sp. Silwood1]CAF4934143.1 unnamed protein product [Rotaria sp. Silwood1]
MSQNNISSELRFDGRFNQNSSGISMINDSLIRIEITHFIQKVNFWIAIAQILMVICGILGNGLALIVINRRSLRDTSSSVFITYLAIFDTSVLVVHIINLATQYWIHSYILHCFLAYLTDLVTFCSVWVMVIMTLERCVAVHSPFLAKRFCTIERARYSIYALIVAAFILFSSTFPNIYTIDKVQQKCIVRHQYQKIIRIVKPTIFYFVPDLLLLANIFIIYELFIATRQRTKTLMNPENAVHQLNAVSFNRKQRQLTIMLVTVSLSFYIFTTPAIIDYIHQMNPPTHHNLKRLKLRFLWTNLSVLWLQMSSATNFLFYCVSGSKFRAACFETIGDICDFLRIKSVGKDDHVRSRLRRRQNKNDIRLKPYFHPDGRNGRLNNQNRRPSTSITQTYAYPLSNSSKRASSETIISTQLNSRLSSKVALNVDEV